MSKLRIGVIGIGFIGSQHAEFFANGGAPGAVLAAVYSGRAEKAEWVREKLGKGVRLYNDVDEFFASKSCDAVVIATPQYSHPELAIKAFAHGLHVLCEKPAGVYTKQVRLMNEAAAASGKVFSMMYNQRTFPIYQKLRELITAGELGDIKRINWIMTNWYRTQSYFDRIPWRAKWATDGGGVLINQDIHMIDILQWATGMMPDRIRAFCYFGKYKNIQVEDDVTAFAEYGNGATCVLTTTTGEAPGTNRLEINGDRGKLVMEDDRLTFWRLRVPEPEYNRMYKAGFFDQPECWKCEIPYGVKQTDQNTNLILVNWAEAILKGTPLIAPGEEGIKGLMLCNAMLLSAWTDDWVKLPIDEDLFYTHLRERAEGR